MMDVRKKLVELLEPHMSGLACEYESGSCELTSCRSCNAKNIADHLIANGVTVQEWISVKEHLPQENEPEDTLCEIVQVLLNNGKVSVGWCNRITKLWYHTDYDKDYYTSNDYDHTPVIAWMPLAQPPKGE